MLVLLIGITPPLEHDEKLISLLTKQNQKSARNDDDAIPIQWLVNDNNNNNNNLIVVKDVDTGDPTMLLQAIVHVKEDTNAAIPEHDIVLNVLNECLLEAAVDDDDDDKTRQQQEEYSCQVWATAPDVLPLRPKGGCYIPSQLTLERDGIQFQHNILSETQVDEFVGVLQSAIHETEALIRQHRPSITLGQSTFAFSEICARGPLRFDLKLNNDATQQAASSSYSSSSSLLVRTHILSQPLIQAQLQTWLHCKSMDEIDFDVSVVYSKPGATHQAWHTDGHYFPNKKAGTYAVCLFVPCLDLSHETGYTQFWPGSHRSEKWMGFGQVAELTESTVDGICRRGEGIWYHYRTWHRGMANTTLETTRLVLQIVFKQSWYVERDNYGTESIVPKQKQNNNK
jgi:ectoine hydroxylase-related dioxygenase (phytanoyl-CoA dioxygenase family)